jgi:CBS domain containing-hemolysin-like protein
LKSNAQKGNKSAKKALEIANTYNKALTAILIGNNIVNILMSSLGTVIATDIFGSSGVAIATAVITVVVLIFGEILPKSFAKNKSELCSYYLAKPLSVWTKIMTPFVILFNRMSDIFSKETTEPSVTEDELKSMIEEIEEQGVLEEHESVLVRSALDFDETAIMEICIPRVQVVGIEKDTSFEEIKETFLSCGYSRLPVYDKNMDNIIGIITYKDFFKMQCDGGKNIETILQDIARISELQTINEAFRQMQKDKIHIAVVLDQYGGTRGIVTLEDIIEELVGEIYDENDEEVADIIKIRDNIYRVSGTMRTSDLLEKLNINDPIVQQSSTVSVGGFIIDLLGHIPSYGEEIKVGRMRFRVIEAYDHSIKKVLLKLDNTQENKQ